MIFKFYNCLPIKVFTRSKIPASPLNERQVSNEERFWRRWRKAMSPIAKGLAGTKFLTHYFPMALVLVISGCTLGHCPGPNAAQKKTSKIWVFKYDKSRQCHKEEGLLLKKMQKELDTLQVKVFMSKKKYDGLMRTQTCGAYTGRANLYLIYRSDFEKVQKKGFEKWNY